MCSVNGRLSAASRGEFRRNNCTRMGIAAAGHGGSKYHAAPVLGISAFSPIPERGRRWVAPHCRDRGAPLHNRETSAGRERRRQSGERRRPSTQRRGAHAADQPFIRTIVTKQKGHTLASQRERGTEGKQRPAAASKLSSQLAGPSNT